MVRGSESGAGGHRLVSLSMRGPEVSPWLAGALTANATGELTPEAIRATDWDRYVGDISSALSGNRNQEIVGSERARAMLAELDDLIMRLRSAEVVEATVQKVVVLRRAVSEAAGCPVE